MRQQRTTLQHEMDILTQSLNQELATLDDTVKNMFNERKMAVKEEQNRIDSYVRFSDPINSCGLLVNLPIPDTTTPSQNFS